MEYTELLKPIRVGHMTWRNRMVMPAMETRLSNPDGSSTPEMVHYYGERAKGGVAAVIVENTYVDDKASRSSLSSSGLCNDHLISSHFYVAEAIKQGGAVAIMQLSHGGRQANGGATGLQAVAPSVIPCKFVQRMPKALTIEEIVEIEDNFAATALRAKMAGFDGVEIHGAHGYLVNEFVSPYTNHREDAYGGSEENRARFPLNIITKVREAVGPNFIIGYRMSATEGVEGGLTPQMMAEFARRIEDKVDYIHVASGIYETMEQYIITPNYEPHAVNVPFAKLIKQAVTKCPVIVVNSLNPDSGEKALEEGAADIIAFGRSLIADPYLPRKLAEGRREDVRPCCRGHEGCVSSSFVGCPLRCEVNPQAGREKDWKLKKTADPKRVVVVGGGVAGMEAARLADALGHRVTLLEKTDVLGGHFIEATQSDFKTDHAAVLKWLCTQIAKSGVDVRMKTEATPEMVKALNPDAVFVATGSKYIRIPVEGIEKALMPDDVLMKRVEVGQKVAVIGGGLVGTETALELSQQGKEITIIEMLPEIAMQDEALCRISLMKHLAAAGVTCLTNSRVTRLADGKIYFLTKEGEKTLEVDSVVAATGLRADTAVSEPFDGVCSTVVRLGDAVKGGKIFDCFHNAWLAVRNLDD